ncbi:hypothetical protein SLEP1_g45378 [Rubroshorea leprosula]|uniref:Uncharacterized protein n=1 Tax=Rubroshorea leprosula TaxID=152421 RepID=A0AAV5LKI3_9ROSI|nr:hypothetical protein SLEP1_g45378 [Rubroshorea leprosula]
MVRTFTRGHPPRNEVDEQEDAQVSEPGLNDFRPMPRNLFVRGAEQDHLIETDDDERTPTGYATQPEHFQVPTGTRQRQPRQNNSQHERPERSTEPARTTKLEERTRVLEMAMGKILARLIPNDPLIPLLNRDAQPATVVATRNSPALSNIVVPTKPRGSRRLNNEPSSSRHNEELMRKNANLERPLRDVQKSIDVLKSPRSHQQTLDLDSAPLNLSITAEPYQEEFKIPHLETYDGSGDPNEHLHTYQAIMRIQNANDAMMCKVFPATLKSTARRWYHKLPRHSIDSYSQLAKLFSNKFASQREIKRTATELMSVSFILSEDFQSSKRRADDKQGKESKQPENRDDKKKQKHWVKRPPPQTHDSSRADRSKYCDYHRVYGHNTEDCQSLKDELEFLACNGKLEGYVQKPFVQQPTQTHFVQEYGRSQAPEYQLSGNPNSYQAGLYSSELNRSYKRRPFNRRGQGQKAPTQNQKDHRGVGYGGIPPPSGTINMISGVSFLVVKMESAFNVILGRATLCELKAIISQPHLCMKFPTPRGPEGVEQKAKPVKPVETVPLNPDVPERTVKIDTKLTEEERVELLEFLRVNQDVFAWTTDEMHGIPVELTVHKLSTDPTRRRVEYFEWVSNPVLVKKPSGKWRMCIDFTNLNDACPKDPHPLPNVEKLIERAAEHERMSFLDASSGYHQVQLLLNDQEKTAFYTGDAIYCYVMMPFGLKNAVTSVRAEDHIGDLSETFQNLRRAQMKLNPLKCTFAVESRKFLGYVVSKKGIEVNPKKVQAIQQMEPPKTIKDVQRLTGRVTTLHRFIARGEFVSIPGGYKRDVRKLRAYFQSHQIVVYTDLPLRKILQKPELSGQLIGWSIELSEYDFKFQPRTTIKGQAVANFLVECTMATVEEKALEHPVWVLYVDEATNVEGSGAGAVLVGPYGFKSKHALKFKFQTTNNAAEYEALIYGLKLASELKIDRIQVFSDSQLVVGQIDKIPRADNQQADELSRLASSQETNPHRSTTMEVLGAPSYTDFTVECQLLSTNPSSPSWTTPLINYLQSGELPEDPSAAKLIKRRAAHFTLLDNQLYKRATSMPLLRCLTPYEVEYVVREVHEGVCGTNIGGKTLARKLLRHGYYWPTMVKNAQSYVKKCPTYQFNADEIHMPREMLSSLSSPWPFTQWGVDLLGPFVKGKGGCIYLVVAVDYFTKWIEAKPLSTTTEKKIEEFLFNSILCRFGIPKRIIADNGPQFRAIALRSFCNDYGIELALTSVYTPQSNGQAESANKIVLRGLKVRVLASRCNWVDELNKVLWSCRTTLSSATGQTPFSLVYRAEAVIPVEIGLPSKRADLHDDPNNEQLLREKLDLVEEVREMSRIRNMAH